MGNNNDTTVGLYINGKQAEKTLAILEKEAENLGKQLEDAVRRGDKVAQKQLNKSLKDVNQTIKQIQSSTKNVADVMARLDKATPHELRKTLTTLNNQLKHIERGSSAWTEHMAKIKMVKAELDKVNAEMKQSESLLVRMRNGIQNWGAMAAGAVAAFSGVVMAGKKAVATYAEMQQEEANVRKYTGMTEEQVNHLNDAFKKMDTRTSREELNKLAQEAGRLGKQSEEDVLGFVRAADKINVALDDLGDGATLTLSKLTTIFGDEERLGTEKALLSVGSVINELSQNSTASAPYLAEFAQRLAGVGAQAQMTIPEIMGFGAVLDSQGQKLEMSATALSKVIMNLFKDPAKIASATGLAVEEFSETCKRSTNEGLLMLLDRLHELGGIDALAPVFKDMGENGARASAVLAALAGNVDTVRQQQEAANVAFSEAVSIDKEFNVQNTTVQAGLEKARKGFTEMAVTLGKELMPIVSKVISSTSMTMRVMLKVIQFVKEYRTEIIGLAAAVAAYYTIMKAQDAWNAFTGGIKKAIAGVKEFNAALKANPYAAITALVMALGTALYGFIKRQREAAKAADEHRKALERQQEAEKKTASAVGEVVSKYQLMKQEWEKLTTAQQKREWLEKNRDAFEQLGLNITNAVEADEAFIKSSDKVIAALKARAKANALQDLYQEKIEQVYKDAASQEDTMKRRSAGDAVGFSTDEWKAFQASGRSTEGMFEEKSEVNAYTGDVSKFTALTEKGAAELNAFLDEYHQQVIDNAVKTGTESVEQMFGSMYATAQTEAAKAEAATGGLVGNKPAGNTSVTPVTGGGEQSLSEKELKEQHDAAIKEVEDWKKREQSIIELAYAKGDDTYSKYQKRLLQMEKDYHAKRLEEMTEGTTEYYQEQARYEKQMRTDNNAKALKEQQDFWADEKRCLDEQYMAGEINYEKYVRSLEDAELDFLANKMKIYKKGSQEYLQAEEVFIAKEHEIQKKRFDERKKIEDNIKKLYFTKSDMYTSDTEEYEKQVAALDVVYSQLKEMAGNNADERLAIEKAYQEAKYLLAKEYNQKSVMETMDAWRAAGDEIMKFLESDLGQNMAKGFGGLVGQMSSLFSALTSNIDAETDLQKKEIDDRYAAEIEAAGNNTALVADLEAKKQDEIAQIETEAANKKFNMQVIETVATGIQSAVSAFAAGWQAGIAGVVLGPLFMAMSLATTGIQIAALKKQRDLAAATGYAEGGYTKPGRKYEPAGIVHAGEWVASQELLANPTAAATIAQLDQAQRTNTIGQLGRQQVSESVSSPVESAPVAHRSGSEQDNGLARSIQKLNQRLDEPFVNVNTVTGDKGVLRALKRHEQLMRNKSKK